MARTSKTSVALFLATLLALPSVCWGHELREVGLCGDAPQPDRDAKGQPELPRGTFTISSLTMFKSHLTDTEARFGRSTSASRSYDDDGHGFGECYKSAKWPNDPTVLTFTTGIIADFDELIGFELKSDSSSSAAKCVTSVLVRNKLATSNGLHLGQSVSDMQKLLGPGKPGSDGIRRWLYEAEIPTDPMEAKRSGNDYFLRASGVIARFRDSKADCISVYMVE